MSQKKKQRSLTVGCRATHSKVTGWADNKFEKALTTQARPGHTSRRENVPTFGRDGRSGSPTGRVIFCCVLSWGVS